MSELDDPESIPAFQTLDEPSRLLGLALSGWLALVIGGGLGYAWLLVSPLGWRVNVSLVVIAVGVPAGLLVVREQSTISPGRLLLAVIRWRTRAPLVTAVTDRPPVRRGAIVLHRQTPEHTRTGTGGRFGEPASSQRDGRRGR